MSTIKIYTEYPGGIYNLLVDINNKIITINAINTDVYKISLEEQK